MYKDVLKRFAFAYASLPVTGRIRDAPQDFIVEEELNFVPTGEGEHVWIQVRKHGLTTTEVARMLARHASIPLADIGYSGLKDRRALTSQWFSLRSSSRCSPDWHTLEDTRVEIVHCRRHQKKLRRGTHRRNHFRIVVRDIQGPVAQLEERLTRIKREGVPNYFGAQRFGHDGKNLAHADRMLRGGKPERDRLKRGIYLSAARAWLFNHALSHRVSDGSWNRLWPGEVAMLDGSRSMFEVDAADAVLQARVTSGDLHPTGPLAGAGDSPIGGLVAGLESQVFDQFPAWVAGLARARLVHERRALRIWVPDLQWSYHHAERSMFLGFSLHRGQFATALLRECGRFSE